MSTELVRIDPASFSLEAVTNMRQEALAAGFEVEKVSCPSEQDAAVIAQTGLKRVLKLVEDERVKAKAPAIKYGREIDAAALAFCASVDAEYKRLGMLIKGYQTEQQRIAFEEEQRRQEAIRKAEAERLEAEAKAARARSDAGRAKAQAEAEAAAARAAQAQAAIPVAPAKSEGQIVKRVWKFEVVDVWKLTRSCPGFVEPVPRKREINEAIANGMRDIPGLRIWEEVETGVRLGRAPAAIDV